MISEAAVWAIIGLPLGAGLLIVAGLRPWSPRAWRYSGLVAIAGIGGAFALSLWALDSAMNSDGIAGFAPHHWFTVGETATQPGFRMTVGVLLDPLSAIMLLIVSGVSTLVQVYSLGYMRKADDDEAGAWADYPRYFAYMSLFTAAMLGLILAYNLIQLFVFWELVGLMSYLLIGFWYHRPAAAAAAKKAFIVTRIGDFGFLLALFWIFYNRDQFAALGVNPFEIPSLISDEVVPLLSAGLVTWASLGVFAGAVGKSAQLPLNTWLPDAMEGPTPVSSLIHAATMVAAGVFLVARLFPLFEASSSVLNTVAMIGAVTALAAAAMALVTNDIKRVLAFSTVSQLGYMFLALGVGAPGVAIFHLFNHAFFKCLLFLGAGSVHHSVHTFDMRYMGGLRRWMPVTYVTMIIAGLSLAGIFPMAGFWSKDEVLAFAWQVERDAPGHEAFAQVVFWIGLIAAGLTGFYIFRLIFMTFHGEFRGGIDSVPMEERIPDEAHHQVHRHESPWTMAAPMVVLAVFAIFSGIVANSFWELGPVPVHWFSHLLHEEAPEFNRGIAIVSSAAAVAGILGAVLVYGTRTISIANMPAPAPFMHRLLEQRFYMDYLYETIIVKRVLYRGVFQFSDWFDRRVVDGVADLIGLVGRNGGRVVAQLQNGQVQAYGVGVTAGVIALLGAFLIQR
jgi:NADH-quinone oxidoreductase subunit L